MPIGEPVSECSICGLDFPESQLVKHYKTGRLVDRLCADEPSGSDYLEKMQRPIEKRRRAKQPVPLAEQSQDSFITGFNQRPWNVYPFNIA